MKEIVSDAGLLAAGDVVFTSSAGWFQRLIRWGQRSPGEAPALTNHALLIVAPPHRLTPEGLKPSLDNGDATIIEAQAHVQAGKFGRLQRGAHYKAYRPLGITRDKAQTIVSAGLAQLHLPYGFAQLFLQLIDAKLLGGRNVARRLTRIDPLPICSKLVALAYASAGFDFGIEPHAADPDTMEKFCLAHPERYYFVAEGDL